MYNSKNTDVLHIEPKVTVATDIFIPVTVTWLLGTKWVATPANTTSLPFNLWPTCICTYSMPSQTNSIHYIYHIWRSSVHTYLWVHGTCPDYRIASGGSRTRPRPETSQWRSLAWQTVCALWPLGMDRAPTAPHPETEKWLEYYCKIMEFSNWQDNWFQWYSKSLWWK